jgi:DNA-binding NarL/FixJ family response regulator
VLRVVIAEDNLLVREGVVRLIDLSEGVETVAAVGTYDELIAAVVEHSPDVVVTDIRMPPTMSDEGIRAARELRTLRPDVGVVVLSQYAEPAYALALLEHGSGGRAYLLKERVADPAELVAAIYAVADGGSVIDPRVVEVLVNSRNVKASPLEQLTTREKEVLAEMAQGKNNAAIGAALFLSDRAVEKHINALFSKLGLSEEIDVHRRVKAVLVFLSSAQGTARG